VQVTPFKDQGYYTEFHNALLDAVMPALKPTSWAILCAIIRQTKGWRRDFCHLSLATITALSGVKSRTTVIECLDELRSFKQGARPVPLIIEYPGDDQWSPKSYGLNRGVRIEWEPLDVESPSPKNEQHCCSKNGQQPSPKNEQHCCSKNGQPIRKEENHVGEERGKQDSLSGPNDSFQAPLPEPILHAELSKMCGCAPVNGGELKLERAAVSIAAIGGTVDLLREYSTAESNRIFKIEFIASEFGGWLARRRRNGGFGNGSHSSAIEYCPECAGSKRVRITTDGKWQYAICPECNGTGRKEAR